MPIAIIGVASGLHSIQSYFGTADNFFYGCFTTDKDPHDIAEFYQAEDLLKIVAIHPILFNLFMDKVVPEQETITEDNALLNTEETKFHVKHFGMEVSFEIIEQQEEAADGEQHLVSFVRHERFIDWAPFLNEYGIKLMLWDQTWKYGFKRLEDGKLQVFHEGERFYGPWPIRVLIFFHQYYVLWACEKFINSDVFGTDDLDTQEEMKAELPKYILKNILAKLRGVKEKRLANLESEPLHDEDAIAQLKSKIDKLKRLENTNSTIALVKGQYGIMPYASNKGIIKKRSRIKRRFQRVDPGPKIIVDDSEMHDALQEAVKEAKENEAVNTAMQELVQTAELEWKLRPASMSRKTEGKWTKNMKTDLDTASAVEYSLADAVTPDFARA